VDFGGGNFGVFQVAVYPRGKKGIYHVDFEFRGQRIKRTTGTAALREAQAFERRLRAELEARYRLQGDRPSMSVAEANNRYLATVIRPKNNPDKDNARDIGYLQRFENAFGAATLLEQIKTADIDDYQAARLEHVKPGTLKRELNVFKAVLNMAVKAGRLGVAPAFPRLQVNDARIRWLTEEEEAKLLADSPPWLTDLLTFCLDTGARKGEGLGLLWEEVDFQIADGGRGVVRLMRTKNDEPRAIPMTLRVRAMLERLEEDRPQDQPSVFLWPSRFDIADGVRIGDMVPIGDFKKTFTEVKEQAHIEDFTLHDTRHTFASRLVMKGVPLLDVSKLLGHKSIQMTMRYAHLAPGALDGAIAVLDND